MTTIAYRAGWVASDSRVSLNDIIQPREVRKLWRVGKSVFGICGSIENWETMKEWLEFGGVTDTSNRPKLDEDSYLLEFMENGRIFEHRGSDATMEITPLMKDFYAWGSGWQVALGALEHGAEAAEAVATAARYDAFTGGTVYALQILKRGEDF